MTPSSLEAVAQTLCCSLLFFLRFSILENPPFSSFQLPSLWIFSQSKPRGPLFILTPTSYLQLPTRDFYLDVLEWCQTQSVKTSNIRVPSQHHCLSVRIKRYSHLSQESCTFFDSFFFILHNQSLTLIIFFIKNEIPSPQRHVITSVWVTRTASLSSPPEQPTPSLCEYCCSKHHQGLP